MKTLIALLGLGGVAFGADATLTWSLDCTNGQYTMLTGESPLAAGYCSNDFVPGIGVKTSGSSKDGSGIALNSQTQKLESEFSIVMSLESVATVFDSEAADQQLTLMALKKSDGYIFSVYADSRTGVINLDLGAAEVGETCNNLTLIGNNATKAQTITLTFGNVEGSGNALVSVYLDDELASSTEMRGAWRTNHDVAINLLTGFGKPGVAAVVSGVSYYNGALTQAQISEIVPEPTTATLSLLALAGLAARRRRK